MKEKLSHLGLLKNCFVAGGAITSLYTNKPINDYDIYPKSVEAMENAIVTLFEDGYFCCHASSRALTFSKEEERIQIMVFDTYETADKIFGFFDFTVCMGAFDIDTQKFILHDNFLIHCSQRFLSFNVNTKFPYASAWRVRKYEERGFSIGKMEYFKILLACQNSPVNSWEDLKEQVGGVYGESMEIPEDEEYSFDRAINVISNMKPSKTVSGYVTAEEAIACVSKREIPYFVASKQAIMSIATDANNTYTCYADIFNDGNYTPIPCKPLNGKLVDMDVVYPGLTFYKKVYVDENGVFRSIFKNTFIYELGSEVSSESPYIYCYHTFDGAKNHFQSGPLYKKMAILTLTANKEDVIYSPSGKLQLKKCKVIGAQILG